MNTQLKEYQDWLINNNINDEDVIESILRMFNYHESKDKIYKRKEQLTNPENWYIDNDGQLVKIK